MGNIGFTTGTELSRPRWIPIARSGLWNAYRTLYRFPWRRRGKWKKLCQELQSRGGDVNSLEKLPEYEGDVLTVTAVLVFGTAAARHGTPGASTRRFLRFQTETV
jgi:hypothetical protein